jgi:hypothetical protein
MKLRHTALLALVGWYLIVPPLKSPGSMAVDESAPLTKWRIFKSFDSVKECEALRAKITQGEKGTEFYAAILTSACVASDDPRFGKGTVK